MRDRVLVTRLAHNQGRMAVRFRLPQPYWHVAQLAEQETVNLLVVGSSPTLPAILGVLAEMEIALGCNPTVCNSIGGSYPSHPTRIL